MKRATAHTKSGRVKRVRRVITEEEMREVMLGYAPQKYLTRENWWKLRQRSRDTHVWQHHKFDLWIAKEVEAGWVRVAPTTPGIGTKEGRKEMIERMEATGPQAQMLTLKKRVRDMIQTRKVTTDMSAPIIKVIEKNLAPRGPRGGRNLTAATIIMVAIEDNIRLHDRRQSNGRPGDTAATCTKREWAKEAMEAALGAGWITKKEQESLLRQAKKLIQAHPAGEENVCLVFGEGAHGATEGLEMEYDKVYSIDLETVKLGGGKETVPDFLFDWQKGKDFKEFRHFPAGIVGYLCQKAGVRKGELKAIWASPSCTEESVAQAIMKGKPQGRGYYAGVPRSKQAQGSLEVLIEGLKSATEKDPRIQICLENPASSALQ